MCFKTARHPVYGLFPRKHHHAAAIINDSSTELLPYEESREWKVTWRIDRVYKLGEREGEVNLPMAEKFRIRVNKQ